MMRTLAALFAALGAAPRRPGARRAGLALFAAAVCFAGATHAHAQAETQPHADDAIAALIAAAASDLPTTDDFDGPAPAPPPAGRAAPPMWRVAGADSEIWLLGSFHVLPEGLDWRSRPLMRAADLAQTVWFEAEVDTPAARQATLDMLRAHGFNPDGVRLSSLLAKEDAARLKDVAGRLGLPLAQIDRMRPWQAFLALSVQFISSQGFQPGSGVESALLAEARARGRTMRFFETVEQQLALFSDLDPATERHLLSVSLRDWDNQESEFRALFDAWRAGDAREIDRLMNRTMREQAPEVYERLIVARNRAWAKRIAQEMRSPGRALIAVGAAHLVGEDSVPAMLRAEGFEVTRYGAE